MFFVIGYKNVKNIKGRRFILTSVLLSGKIISKIDFKFFYNSKKHVSVAKFIIETSDNINKKVNYIFAKAYDMNADTIFSSYNKNKRIAFSRRA